MAGGVGVNASFFGVAFLFYLQDWSTTVQVNDECWLGYSSDITDDNFVKLLYDTDRWICCDWEYLGRNVAELWYD